MLKLIVTFLLFAALWLQPAGAQDLTSASQMGFSDLLALAEAHSEANRPSDAIPLLEEIIARAASMPGSEESIQMARLLLGAAYAKLERWETARSYIDEYLKNKPVKEEVTALQILCQIDLGEKNWESLNQNAQRLREQKGLSIQKKEEIEQFYAQALYNGGNYEKALEILPDVIAKAKDTKTALAYRVMLIRCLHETKQVSRLIAELPLLFRGESRTDVNLNLTLLRIGDALFDSHEYRQALSIFRVVMPKTELLNLNRAQYQADVAKKKLSESELEERKKLLDALEEVPNYDLHLSYRAAQIYAENKRFWEAMGLFDLLFEKNAEDDTGRAAYLQKVMLLFEVGAHEEAIAESVSYLDKNTVGLFPRIICTRLAQHYLQQGKFKEALDLETRYVSRWVKSTEPEARDQETELRYLLSFGYFQQGDYEKAAEMFDQVSKMAPESEAGIDSHYWKAMCRLLQKDYVQAYDMFISYRDKWPRAGFAAAALFRSGVCRFGLEDYAGAKTIFNVFITTYSEDALMPEALSMYADILASEGLIDQALEHYDRVVAFILPNYENTTDPLLKKQMVLPATYAVLQAAQALELDAQAFAARKENQSAEAQYQNMIRRIETYMKQFGDDADWAQGVFWMGKAQLALGQTSAAVQAYLDTVLRYGSDPAQDGVAAILFDLADIIKTRQDAETQIQTKTLVQKERDTAASPTLRILLDVLLAELNSTQDELGKTLLENEKDLALVPPSGLALMCEVLRKQADYTRAEEFYNHFLKYHELSPFIVHAYRLRAEDLFLKKEYKSAHEMVVQVIDLFGATEETGWAQLLKGNIEVAQGDYKAAEDSYNRIFSVRLWRGPVSAEAMFRLAESWYAQGNYEKAFAFFQRTYLLYKAYDGGRWAADAYVRSAECLMKLGREPDARNTYRAMLLDEYVRHLPQAEEAKKVLGLQEAVALLAGKTNTMEAVKGEETPK